MGLCCCCKLVKPLLVIPVWVFRFTVFMEVNVHKIVFSIAPICLHL